MTPPDNGLPKDVVPPGNQTGSYYIPVANLPFGTTWQGFKDFVRPVCSVDHVEIFPKSTSGWFRVNGYQSFIAAFDLFKTTDFMGRAIIADNRNAAMPLKVRDLDISNSARVPNRPTANAARAPSKSAAESSPYAKGGPVTYPDPTVLKSPAPATRSPFVQGSRDIATCMTPSNYVTSPDRSFAQAITPRWEALASQPSAYDCSPVSATPSIYGASTAPDRQPALYNRPASYAVQPVQPYGEYYPPPIPMSLASQLANLTVGAGSTGGAGGGVVYTEQRGIHIRDLPRRASEDQVRKMIREAAGREAGLITGVDVPLDKDRSPRGWAHVHYHSADLARRMVSVMNGREFKGKKLQARLLKEGETVGGVVGGGGGAAGSSKGHRSGKHSGRRDEEGKRRGKDRGERSSATKSSSQPSPPVNPGPPVIGDSTGLGSSSSGSSKDKDKEKGQGKEKHVSKCAVVIANGSLGSRRKGDDSDRRAS